MSEKCGCKIEEIKKSVKKVQKNGCGCDTETVKKLEPKKNEDRSCECGK